MSDLQLSLLVIGAVVVGAVYLYNVLQERGLRRRMQQSFSAGHDDVLLKAGFGSALPDGRLEPQLAPQGSAQAAPDIHPPQAAPAAGVDDTLDYVAVLEADGPIGDALVSELMSRAAACGKPVHGAGLDAQSGNWEDVVRGKGGRYRAVRLALQLVNRAGPVNATQLATFCDAVKGACEKMGARASFPDVQEALKRARELDAFCAETDVAVGFNVVAADGESFPGTRIRAAAEAAGFRLEPDGVFHFRDDRRHTLFTLDNHEPAPFLPESIAGLTTRGVTLLLDVPRVGNGAAALECMLGVAGDLANALGGELVDDNRVRLSEAGIARIKEQVGTIQARMDLQGIPAGGTRALRLFS